MYADEYPTTKDPNDTDRAASTCSKKGNGVFVLVIVGMELRLGHASVEGSDERETCE